jgi:hypothetical protein
MRWEFVFSLQKTAETERFTASEEPAQQASRRMTTDTELAAILRDGR